MPINSTNIFGMGKNIEGGVLLVQGCSLHYLEKTETFIAQLFGLFLRGVIRVCAALKVWFLAVSVVPDSRFDLS